MSNPRFERFLCECDCIALSCHRCKRSIEGAQTTPPSQIASAMVQRAASSDIVVPEWSGVQLLAHEAWKCRPGRSPPSAEEHILHIQLWCAMLASSGEFHAEIFELVRSQLAQHGCIQFFKHTQAHATPQGDSRANFCPRGGDLRSV